MTRGSPMNLKLVEQGNIIPTTARYLVLGGPRPTAGSNSTPHWEYHDWGIQPVYRITQLDWPAYTMAVIATPPDTACLEALHRCIDACPSSLPLILHGWSEEQIPARWQAQLRYHSPQQLPVEHLQQLLNQPYESDETISPFSQEQQQELQRCNERISYSEDWYQALTYLCSNLAVWLNAETCQALLWQPAEDHLAYNEYLVFCSEHRGICAFALSSGQTISVPHAHQDPRFNPATDLPTTQRAPGNGHILCMPLFGARYANCVLRLYRSAQQAEFSAEDCQQLEQFLAALSEPLKRQWLLHARPDIIHRSTSPALHNPVFRHEALRHLIEGERTDGDILVQDPPLTRWTYWVLLAGLFAMLLFLTLGHVNEYASGPALIRIQGASEVTAIEPGTVSELLVSSGSQVTPGTPLLKLYHGRELADVRRLEQEFAARVRQRLLNPDDRSIETLLINLRSELTLARSRLAERTLVSHFSGRVGDIRARPGQYVNSGQTLINIIPDEERIELVAFIPGRYRPQLETGMRMRLELNGYPYEYQELQLNQIDEQVIGPQQARAIIGSALADTLNITGPLVLVKAALPDHFRTREGQQYAYHEGMLAQVQISLESEPIIQRLLPGLKLLQSDPSEAAHE